MATFTLDGVIAARSFTMDAVILGAGRWQHDRQEDHYGPESDLVVVLSQDIGPWVAYTPIHYVLASIMDRLASLESTTKHKFTFAMNAVIDGRAFTINARILATTTNTGSFVTDAVIDQGLSFSVDAYIIGAFTINAFIL